MAETVPTTPQGILALARLADAVELGADEHKSRMVQRIIEALFESHP